MVASHAPSTTRQGIPESHVPDTTRHATPVPYARDTKGHVRISNNTIIKFVTPANNQFQNKSNYRFAVDSSGEAICRFVNGRCHP